jgi:hypothetical protein
MLRPVPLGQRISGKKPKGYESGRSKSGLMLTVPRKIIRAQSFAPTPDMEAFRVGIAASVGAKHSGKEYRAKHPKFITRMLRPVP